MGIYDFKVRNAKGVDVPMTEYQGKVLLMFEFLKNQKHGFLGNDIKWNFTKFLVSREGTVMARYAPVTKPEKIESDILKLL